MSNKQIKKQEWCQPAHIKQPFRPVGRTCQPGWSHDVLCRHNLCVPLLHCCLLQVSLEALWWVVQHNLTPLNYVLALEASIWFIERAAMEHPKQKVCCWWPCKFF